MIIFQITTLFLVVIYLLYWFSREEDPGFFLLKFITISAASWLLEETSILIYHFYQYSPDWYLFFGHVPVLVILVWPVLIHSGWELASQFFNQYKLYQHVVAALIVWIDASLIESISVKEGRLYLPSLDNRLGTILIYTIFTFYSFLFVFSLSLIY